MNAHPYLRGALVAAGLLAGGCVPSALVSQTSDASPAQQQAQVRAQLDMLRLSSPLRVGASTGRQEGRLLLRTADSLGITGKAGEIRVSRLAVDSLWIRRHHTLPGLLIGTAAGAGAYFLNTHADKYDGSDTRGLDNLLGAAVWAGSALLGTVVGRAIPGWKRVSP
jgi:hypothetical protein